MNKRHITRAVLMFIIFIAALCLILGDPLTCTSFHSSFSSSLLLLFIARIFGKIDFPGYEEKRHLAR